MAHPQKGVGTSFKPINYIFFAIYFFAIAAIHVFHAFLIEPIISQTTYFFAAYAIAQCILETVLLLLLVEFVRSYLPRFLNLSIVAVFFLFLGHLIDFPLVRLMDMAFWSALYFVSQQSYENFIEMLLATNVSIFVWALAGIAGGLCLFSGIFFYWITEKWSLKLSYKIPLSKIAGGFAILSLFLAIWDYGMKTRVSAIYFDRFEKTLPWKRTFFPPSFDRIALSQPLQECAGEEELMRKLDSRVFAPVHRPDIYLFVVESLREDYITAENTPYLQQFKEKNVSFEMAFSNANATHLSWFSLFHSKFPFSWGREDPESSKGGSFPLQLLKRMGYKIHVSSSARLSFYQMNRVIFGEGEYLVDSMFFPDEEECPEPYLRDLSALNHLKEQMQKEGSGRLFIVFLDATHFDYSWPKETTLFNPYEEKVNYFKVAFGRSRPEGIINRYRNALHFIDTQFGAFMEVLQKTPGGSEAVVVLTGDHGEEFYEQGNLFHASGLSHPQINPPLYYRFGEEEGIRQNVKCTMTSHMDIFPTLFHYLAGEDLMEGVLQGESIFKPNRWPYTVIGRFNGSRTPYEYCFHNGKEKLIAEFGNDSNIFNSQYLKILSTKNVQDENLVAEFDAIQQNFGPALERIFSNAK
jgi:glucan phosphoethanolaminetransferase (alkaline phosphatase superfamily)